MDKQINTVEKMRLEFKFSNQDNLYQFMESIKSLYYNQILKAFDEVVLKHCGNDEHVRFNYLEIDIGNILFSDFDKYYIENIRKAIDKAVAEKIELLRLKNMSKSKKSDINFNEPKPSGNTERILTRSEFKLEVIKYFLENSVLPWWSDEAAVNIDGFISELCIEEPEKLNALLIELLTSENIISRIVRQLNQESVVKISEILEPESFSQIELHLRDLIDAVKSIEGFNHIHSNLEELFYGSLLRLIGKGFSGENLVDEFIIDVIQIIGTQESISPHIVAEILLNTSSENISEIKFNSILLEKLMQISLQNSVKRFEERTIGSINKKGADQQKTEFDNYQEIKNKSVTKNTSTPDLNIEDESEHDDAVTKESRQELERIYVNNAGLVLLNPYISEFFNNRGLTNKKGFTNIDSQVKAVHLLQYMVSGSDENPEYLLALNKILCGLDITHPIVQKAQITKKDKSETVELINSIIKNWKALKNTSAGGFTDSFLKREGIIEINNNELILRVERKSYDVLLDYLPWSISKIKLSWMKTVLNVEW